MHNNYSNKVCGFQLLSQQHDNKRDITTTRNKSNKQQHEHTQMQTNEISTKGQRQATRTHKENNMKLTEKQKENKSTIL